MGTTDGRPARRASSLPFALPSSWWPPAPSCRLRWPRRPWTSSWTAAPRRRRWPHCWPCSAYAARRRRSWRPSRGSCAPALSGFPTPDGADRPVRHGRGWGRNVQQLDAGGLRRRPGPGCPSPSTGNRAITSRCGSADVIEALGIALDRGREAVARASATLGSASSSRPRYHPAMKHGMPIRREPPIRTSFNLLGPISSPAGVRRRPLAGRRSPAAADGRGARPTRHRSRARRPLRRRSGRALAGGTQPGDAGRGTHGGARSRSTRGAGLRRASCERLAGGDAELNSAIAHERPRRRAGCGARRRHPQCGGRTVRRRPRRPTSPRHGVAADPSIRAAVEVVDASARHVDAVTHSLPSRPLLAAARAGARETRARPARRPAPRGGRLPGGATFEATLRTGEPGRSSPRRSDPHPPRARSEAWVGSRRGRRPRARVCRCGSHRGLGSHRADEVRRQRRRPGGCAALACRCFGKDFVVDRTAFWQAAPSAPMRAAIVRARSTTDGSSDLIETAARRGWMRRGGARCW